MHGLHDTQWLFPVFFFFFVSSYGVFVLNISFQTQFLDFNCADIFAMQKQGVAIKVFLSFGAVTVTMRGRVVLSSSSSVYYRNQPCQLL